MTCPGCGCYPNTRSEPGCGRAGGCWAINADRHEVERLRARIAELEAESRVVQEANKRLAVERDAAVAENAYFDERAKSAEAQCAVLRDALESVAHWSKDLQDRVEENDTGVQMWRGCVAAAVAALSQDAGKALLERVGLLEAVVVAAERYTSYESPCCVCTPQEPCGEMCAADYELRAALEKGRAP